MVELMRSEREEIGQMQEYSGHILVEMIMFTVMAIKSVERDISRVMCLRFLAVQVLQAESFFSNLMLQNINDMTKPYV